MQTEWQTVYTLIRLLLEEQSDLSLHYLSRPRITMGNSMLFNKEKCKNMRTPGILVVKSVCKHATVKNVDRSEFQLCHLHYGEDGLLNTHTAGYSKDQPRATNCKWTLESVEVWTKVVPVMAESRYGST